MDAPSNLRICEHCGTPYDWRRSASHSLKMTYCGVICEKADLGFTIDYLLQVWQPLPAPAPVEAREPALAA